MNFKPVSLENITNVSSQEVREMDFILQNSEYSKTKKNVYSFQGSQVDFITSVNSTILGKYNEHGQSLGGVRVRGYGENPFTGESWSVEEGFQYAKRDAKNLASAMTRKWAALVLMGSLLEKDLEISQEVIKSFYMGGGKSVIFFHDFDSKKWCHNKKERKELFSRFGEFVGGLNGNYISGEDMNTSPKDMNVIAENTMYASCHEFGKESLDGKIKGTSNPSQVTARGVYHSLMGLIKSHFDVTSSEDISDLRIGVKGIGNVGYHLIQDLHINHPLLFDKQNIIYSDLPGSIGEKIAHARGSPFVTGEEIYSQPIDILADCSVSEGINETTVPIIVKNKDLTLICGAANCQIERDENGNLKKEILETLRDNKVVFYPDYFASLGGILDVTSGFPGRIAEINKKTSYELSKGCEMLSSFFYEELQRTKMLPSDLASYLTSQVLASFQKINS